MIKKFSTAQIRLLSYLVDGLCHSGNDLGIQLQVSRTAIWKYVTQLVDLGLPIQRLPQQGYRLTMPLILLDAQAISQLLHTHHFHEAIDFHLFASIDSTNRVLKELPRSDVIDICCAEKQTAGRGRFGRHWHSPIGENIYCSSRWHFDCDLSHLSGLSLVVSLAVLATLDDMGMGENIRVKWPNDILWGDKKLCGSLIEVVAESNSSVDVIIGIGLNVNSITKEQPPLEKPWCSLFDICGHYTDRNLLIARLIIRLREFLNEFMLGGFSAFLTRWHAKDYLRGQLITVSHLSGSISGRAEGVNEGGQLILIDEHGVTHCLSSGDASLHAMR